MGDIVADVALCVTWCEQALDFERSDVELFTLTHFGGQSVNSVITTVELQARHKLVETSGMLEHPANHWAVIQKIVPPYGVTLIDLCHLRATPLSRTHEGLFWLAWRPSRALNLSSCVVSGAGGFLFQVGLGGTKTLSTDTELDCVCFTPP